MNDDPSLDRTTGHALDRTSLRRDLRERRRALTPAQRLAAAETLAGHLLSLPFAPTNGYVAGYWATDGEIALHAWQLRLPRDVVYCLPVLADNGILRFAPWRPGDALNSNRFGIPEPAVAADAALPAEAMTMIVLPTVGFDMHGQRLGMGGGWYDRTLAFRHGRAAPPWLVGVAFATQHVARLHAEPWDVALDALCSDTDSTIFSPHA